MSWATNNTSDEPPPKWVVEHERLMDAAADREFAIGRSNVEWQPIETAPKD